MLSNRNASNNNNNSHGNNESNNSRSQAPINNLPRPPLPTRHLDDLPLRLGLSSYHSMLSSGICPPHLPPLPHPNRSITVPLGAPPHLSNANKKSAVLHPDTSNSDNSSSPTNHIDHGIGGLMDGPTPKQVSDTLNLLSGCTPFELRHKSDHKNTGRILAFEAKRYQNLDFEMILIVELPNGSGNVFRNDLIHKQIGSLDPIFKEFANSLATNLKNLQYKLKPESDDWKPLTEMLPEQVRNFTEPLKKEHLPTHSAPTVESILGLQRYISAQSMKLANVLQQVKRKSSAANLDEMELGQMCKRLGLDFNRRHMWMQAEALKMSLQNAATASLVGNASNLLLSPSARASGVDPGLCFPLLPPSVLMNSLGLNSRGVSPSLCRMSPFEDNKQLNGFDSLSGPADLRRRSPTSGGRNSVEPTSGGSNHQQQSSIESLRCTLCMERLEDTHFVQCPSVAEHKFCFPCSKESIKRQGGGSEVYCPSGRKCPLVGSSIPWAFMLNEIETILGASTPSPPSIATSSTSTTISNISSSSQSHPPKLQPNLNVEDTKDVKIKKEKEV